VQITLTTAGRRSGQARTVTLYGFEDGERVVVVGSWGGAEKDPAWVHNLRAEPHASIRRGRQEVAVRAHEANGEERDRLWQLVTAAFPLYATYQRRTTRTIPLFALEPVVDDQPT
jgi:deazaflavin-dependent oxidoreductase (nitroreductase family)